MRAVHIRLSEETWQTLVSLGQKENTPPDDFLEQAIKRFLQEKQDRLDATAGLRQSFGIWRGRGDLESDSTVVVDEWRKEWNEREQRFDLL